MKKILLLITFVFMVFFLNAQVGDPNDGNKPGDNPVPISGLEVLLAGGAALGIKSIISKRKKT